MMNIEKKKKRDLEILQTLAKLDLASRTQLQLIHHLGGNRNATRVLKNLDQYLNHFRDIENIYYLNKAGRELTGAKKEVSKASQYEHILMRNDIYINFGCPVYWINEYAIPFEKSKIIPDAVFQVQDKQYFLEVDRQQKMSTNFHKLQTYFRFKESGLWQKMNNGCFPELLYYTVSENRKHQLLEKNPGLALTALTKKDLLW